ncbi:MAG: DEAD/DEAH box helicase [Patescibacteria group bacterium]|nr:DEAD/DEAH box helicase [Patescibacteria group bacterium]
MFDHQVEAVEFAIKRQKCILAHEMGLGKSLMAIMAADKEGFRILVICPASLKINWKREIEKALPDQPIEIVNSDDTVQNWSARWFIINYDILEKKMPMITHLIQSRFDTLILDEAHYIKGKSIRSACVVGGKVKKSDGTYITQKGIAPQMKNVYLLTGTPLLNRPIELFNLLKAIEHPLGQKRTEFARRYCGAFLKQIMRRDGRMIRYVDETGATNLNELREAIRFQLLRRKKDEVLDLPRKMVSVMECDMDREYQRQYDTAWDSYLDFLQANPFPERNMDNILMARHLVEIQKLKQVCSLAKVKRMARDIENAIEQDEKVIVFSQYRNTISEFQEELMEKGIRCVTLTGDDDSESRQRAVDRFQDDPATKVFVANIKAGGVGLNLTEASIVMFADMDWSPEIHNQAIDRAHRIGQTRMVNAYFYVCPGTIEDDIMEILNSKKGVLDKVMEGKQETIRTDSVQAEFLRRMAGRA